MSDLRTHLERDAGRYAHTYVEADEPAYLPHDEFDHAEEGCPVAKAEWIEKHMRQVFAPLVDERMAAQFARLPDVARRHILEHLGIHNAETPQEYVADGTVEAERHANHRRKP